MRKEVIGNATLYLGDSREVLASGEVDADLVFTSPPYAQQRVYASGEIDNWRELVSGVLTLAPKEAQILVNLGLVHRDGEVYPYWDGLTEDMRAAGFRFFGWYVWDQGPGMPGDWAGRLAPAHEWVFHFNTVSRKPNKTVPSKYAGYVRAKPQTGMRQKDGTMSGWSHGTEPTQDNKMPDSVLRITRHKHVGGVESGHPAVFPVQLADEVILAYSDAGQVVLDPFMGSGTSGVSALGLGRRYVGIELDPGYFEIACKRIGEAYSQPDLLIESQPKYEQVALEF
jgi:DNA modification methylase